MLSVDHFEDMVCPVCERRLLQRVYPVVNPEVAEAFEKFLNDHNRHKQKG